MAKLFVKETIKEGMKRFHNYLGIGVANGLAEGAKYLMKEANHLIPIDTGAMIGSGKSGLMPGRSRGIDAVAYVMYDTPYVVYVHEDLNARHGSVFNAHYASDIAAGRTHARRPQEQAKFLEIPAKDNKVQTRIMELVRDEVMLELAKI